MDHILNNDSPEEILEVKRLAHQHQPATEQSIAILSYYRGMRWALDLTDLPWLGLDVPKLNTRELRRECAEQYTRYRELFEMEIAISRQQKSAGMALAQNWAEIRSSFTEDFQALRFRLMLRLAGCLFRVGLPGALDLCDSAVFGMFGLIYLRPVA